MLQGRRRVLTRGIGIGLVAGATAVAANAIAATHTTTTPLPAGTQQFAKVSCAAHTHVRSFGIQGDADYLHDVHFDIPEELGLASARKVIGGARNLSDTHDGSFETTAVCGHSPALTDAVAADNVAAGEQKSLKAKCPRGSAVRLGGFRQEAGPFDSSGDGPYVLINGLQRSSNRTWKVSASNNGTESGRLSSFGYCGDPVHHVHTVTRTNNVRNFHYGTATAKCPRGSKFVMGGLRVQRYAAYEGDIIVTAMGRAGRRGWTVTGYKYLPLSGHLTAIAYCSG